MINTDRLKTQFQAAGQGEVIRAFSEIAAASRASSMAVGGSSARMASALGSIVGTVAVLGTAVAAATAAIGVASVKAAAPIENLQMRFRFAFGDMADAAMASSERIAKSLKRDVEEVQALVLTAKNLEVPNIGRAVGAAYNVSARSVPGADVGKTAQSLVELFGKIQQLDKVSGREIRTMLRSQIPGGAMLEQVMKDMGVAEGATVSGRAALPKLIEVLEKYGGDAAAQQGRTMEGLTRQMKDKIGDIKEAIGLKLLPVLEKIMVSFEPLLNNVSGIANLMANVNDIVLWTLQGLHIVGKTIVVPLAAIAGGIYGIIVALQSGLKWLAAQVLQGVGKIPGAGGAGALGDRWEKEAGNGFNMAGQFLSPSTYANMWEGLEKDFEAIIGRPMRDISAALRSVRNGTAGAVGAVDPLKNAAVPATASKAIAENVTKAVQQYIIGGGSQAGQWMRMLDVGGRAAGAGAIPVKLSEQTGDAFKKFLVQAMSETLVDVLKSPQGKRAIAAAATAR